jgi:glutaredoxin-related protein
MAGIADFIDNEVKNNEIVVFMKGTPDFPQCGFSGQVVQIMNYMGAPYKAINVLADDDLRQQSLSFISKASFWVVAILFAKCSKAKSCNST